MTKPCLYVVATPIGNLQDLSPRAREILTQADLIACEDTRRTGMLLSQLDLGKIPLTSYHDHNEHSKAQYLVDKALQENLSLALVSDAGTPGMADPGYHLTSAAHKSGLKVITVPGPSAPVSLVAASGLPSDRVLFLGFLPQKHEALKEEIQSWAALEASIVCFESAKRLAKTFAVLWELYPEAQLSIGRELTKLYEEIITGNRATCEAWLKSRVPLKGELVLMISLPKTEESEGLTNPAIQETIQKLLENGVSQKTIMEILAPLNLPKKLLYQLILKAKEA